MPEKLWGAMESSRRPSPYRDRVFYGLAVAGALTLLPFSINNFLQGRVALAAVTALVVVGFFVNAFAIYRGKAPPVPPALVFLPAILALPMAVRSQGVVGVLWTYPALVMFHFVLERRVANALNISLVALVAPMAYGALGPSLTVRVVVTLGLTILFSNIFSSIVETLQRQLEEEAIRDPLTGAYNRRHMTGCLGAAWERHRRHGTPVSLLICDADRFKEVNDQLGHAEGDRALCHIVATLRGRLRSLDLLFRSGGEEFLMLLPATDLAGAVRVAEDLRASLAASPPLLQRPITISVGVAALGAGEDAESWIRRADRALYRAKELGRDRVVAAEAGDGGALAGPSDPL